MTDTGAPCFVLQASSDSSQLVLARSVATLGLGAATGLMLSIVSPLFWCADTDADLTCARRQCSGSSPTSSLWMQPLWILPAHEAAPISAKDRVVSALSAIPSHYPLRKARSSLSTPRCDRISRPSRHPQSRMKFTDKTPFMLHTAPVVESLRSRKSIGFDSLPALHPPLCGICL